MATAKMTQRKKAEMCLKQALKYDAIEGELDKVEAWLVKACTAEDAAVLAGEKSAA